MPRMPYFRYAGTHFKNTEVVSYKASISSPAAADVFEFGAYAVESGVWDLFAANKIETTEDLFSRKIRTFDDEVEHTGPFAPANDFPAPQYADERKHIHNTWVAVTQVGARDLRICDINAVASGVNVYQAINGPNGQVNPHGFEIRNLRTGESCWVTSTSHAANYDTFSGMARGWGGTVAQNMLGHDQGSTSLGPPPVPPDTVHDWVLIKVFDTALLHSFACGSVYTAVVPRPIPYAPKGSRNGIFMPIILRYLADVMTKTKTTVVTTTKKKTKTPSIATGCMGPQE
jgi:hypothetical protein